MNDGARDFIQDMFYFKDIMLQLAVLCPIEAPLI